MGGLLIKLFVFDLPGWAITYRMAVRRPYSFRDAGLRLVDFGAVVGFFAGAYALLVAGPRTRERRRVPRLLPAWGCSSST